MFERAKYKEAAKMQLKGKWGISALSFLLLYLAVIIASIIPYAGNYLVLILNGPIMLGLCIYAMRVVNGEPVTVELLFSGFKDFIRALLMYLWMYLWVFLWSLLLIVPGIIKGISYSMCFYILAENPGMSVRNALKRSMELTEGYKMDLFIMQLSFLGWGLLCTLTLGVGYLWLFPYIQVSTANAYYAMKQAKVENISPNDTLCEQN